MIPWPRRPRLVTGNWKMHKTAAEGGALAADISARARRELPCEIAVCPPFTAIEAVAAALRGGPVRLGAQNLHAEPQGAYTGEIAGAMLVAHGCQLVIVGHSERRHGMGETDAIVAAKLNAARRDGLVPIVCVGETLAEREAGGTDAVLERQVGAAYAGLGPADAAVTVVAYEPVWAIGTGRVASPEQARAAHRVIRSALDRGVGPGVGEGMAILYGGSVNANNAVALFAEEDLDGALVGGASLDAPGFWSIALAAGGSRAPR